MKKVLVKLVVEAEYELNDQSPTDLLSLFKNRVRTNITKIVNHSNDDSNEIAAELISWDFHTAIEDL